MEDLLDFGSQATDEEFWAKDKLNSKKRMAQGRSQNDFLPRPPAQRKKHSKPHKKTMVNNSVVRVFTSSVHKTAFQKQKDGKAQQTI